MIMSTKQSPKNIKYFFTTYFIFFCRYKRVHCFTADIIFNRVTYLSTQSLSSLRCGHLKVAERRASQTFRKQIIRTIIIEVHLINTHVFARVRFAIADKAIDKARIKWLVTLARSWEICESTLSWRLDCIELLPKNSIYLIPYER